MRTIKDPVERRNEILDTAEMLFITKGYSKTTVNDILQEIGIAKGTFYYYFKSKEEVMDAMIGRVTEKYVSRAKEIAALPGLSVNEKIIRIFMADRPDEKKAQMIEQLHEVENAQLHQKSNVETILQLTPVLTDLLEQGIKEGSYHTPFPREVVEFLLVSSQFLFDDGIFKWKPEEQKQKALAFIWVFETLLGAEKGSLSFVADMLNQS